MTARAVGALAVCCGVVACDDASRAPGDERDVVTWVLSSEPVLQIGVEEGEPAYEFDDVGGSLRLSDGRMVIADGGSSELRFFDADGRFVSKSGGQGGGPGEFRWLRRLYPLSADSFMAHGASGGRLSVFDDQGRFARVTPIDRSRDSIFPMEEWLRGRVWATGVLPSARRQQVNAVLDQIDPGSNLYLLATVDDLDYVWVSPPSDEHTEWTVYDPAAIKVARVETPARFEMHQIGLDFVLGRWRDASDVHFVRLYSLDRAGMGQTTRPPLMSSPRALSSEPDDQARRAMLDDLIQIVLAQETHYADHRTYTGAIVDLEWTSPHGYYAALSDADDRGFAVVMARPDVASICVMTIGAATPVGWNDGVPYCGQ